MWKILYLLLQIIKHMLMTLNTHLPISKYKLIVLMKCDIYFYIFCLTFSSSLNLVRFLNKKSQVSLIPQYYFNSNYDLQFFTLINQVLIFDIKINMSCLTFRI